MIIYGSLTDTSIGKLFIAGIIPGLLLTACFMLFIMIYALVTGTAMREDNGAAGEAHAPAEGPGAAGGGVLHRDGQPLHRPGDDHRIGRARRRGVACSLPAKSRKLNWTLLQHCFVQTAKTSGMILLIITAAFILNLAISLTGVAEAMTAWVTSFGLSATQMLLVLIVFYFLLGMFMDVLSMMVATIPITFPIVTASASTRSGSASSSC